MPSNIWLLIPGWPTKPLAFLEFLNINDSASNIRLVVNTSHVFSPWQMRFLPYPSLSIGHNNRCLRWELCISCAAVFEADLKLQLCVKIFFCKRICLSNSLPWPPLEILSLVKKEVSSVPLCLFHSKRLIWLSIYLAFPFRNTASSLVPDGCPSVLTNFI